jgi:predicted permease
MKWKNVLGLISVDIKSGRLIRGQRLRKYRESRVLQYVMYGGGCFLGIVVGLFAGIYYNMIKGTAMEANFLLGAKSLFIAAPTLVLTYILIFTMMNQMQRSGIQLSIQPPYWLPITWGEHTLASILANLIGIQLAALIFIVSAISVVSVFIGEFSLAALTIFAILAIAFLASATTEIFRVLQVRLTGAVYKSSGRAAIWVRFFVSILLFAVFYLVYFFFISGANYAAILRSFASGQETLWFIPYIWLGMALFSFANGQILETVVFSLGSVAFLSVLFIVAVKLNRMFGLYEPPAIRISPGVYTPKAGIWGRLGFSSSEVAMMRKDFKALTRRRELMFLFVLPIVIIISMITVPQAFLFTFALILLMPGAFVAVMLGSMIIGEEGAPVWHLYSSPITAESLIKSKYAFIVIFSCAVTLACGIVGILILRPSVRMIFAALIESIFLIVSISAVSLLIGIKGADFTEVPRPRMIRPLELFINLIICLILAIVILAPLIAYVSGMMFFPNFLPQFYLYIALAISGAIAATVTYVFYRIDVKNAKDFLAEAEI